MKNKKGTIITILLVVVVLIAAVALLIRKNNEKPELPSYNPQATNSVVTKANANEGENSADVKEADIKVVKKYSYMQDDDYKMILVLENTGKGDAAVAIVGKIYDGANNVAGTERKSIFLDPGAQSVVDLDFDTEGVKVKNEDYKISVANATSIKPGVSKITSKSNNAGNIVTVTSKNTASFDLQGVEAYVLFFDGDDVVDIESEEVGNEASEVFEKGTTRTQKFDTHEPFKKIKVYYTQTQDEPDGEDND